MKLINIGFSNLVAAERIVTLASPDSAPIKRLIQDSREDGRVIDCSCGKKVKTVILTDSDHLILSALPPETVAERASGTENTSEVTHHETD